RRSCSSRSACSSRRECAGRGPCRPPGAAARGVGPDRGRTRPGSARARRRRRGARVSIPLGDRFAPMDDGTKLHDPRARVAELLERFARERNVTLPPLSADGTGSIQRGSAVVTIHVFDQKNILLLLAKVATAPRLDEARARKLLTLSFVDT